MTRGVTSQRRRSLKISPWLISRTFCPKQTIRTIKTTKRKTTQNKATISRALDFIEKKGFITRERQTAKIFKHPLLLTEKGKKAGKKTFDAVDRVLDEVDVGLTDGRKKTFTPI